MSSRHFHRRYQSIDIDQMDDTENESADRTWLQDDFNSMPLKRSEMNDLVMDYLVHEGFKEAAERFREEAGLEASNLRFSSDLTAIDETRKLRSNSTNSNGSTNNSNHRNNTSSISTQNDLHSSPKESKETNGKHSKSRPAAVNGWSSTPTSSSSSSSAAAKIETEIMMDKRVEVKHSIEEGRILEGQSLINLYYPELLDNHKNLYFKLQQQHLIELIRQQKINEVLSYVHEQLSVDELADLSEMERTLALLAYEQPDRSPYASLLEISHRLQLASEINDIILQETVGEVEPSKPRLVTLLKLLYWTQSELERKKIQYPKMTNLINGTIVDRRHS